MQQRSLSLGGAGVVLGVLALVAPGASRGDTLTPSAVKQFVNAQGMASCLTNAADATLTYKPTLGTDGTALPYAKLPVPANPKPIFWDGGFGCARQYVVEIPVTKASLPTTMTAVHFAYTIGGRNGKWESPSYGAVVTSDELAPECKPLDGACFNKVMPDRCSHMILTVTNAWKKSGQTAFTFYRSVAFSMTYDPPTSSCTLDTPGPGNENYNGLVKLTQAEVTASGVYRVPPAGETDVYRVILAASYAERPVKGNGGTWPTWVGGGPGVPNNIAAQYPVGLYLKTKP
jgi:hypothetical protein